MLTVSLHIHKMEKAILYVRVSSKEQKEKGFSLQAQEQKLRNYYKNYDIIDVVSDKTSGTKRDREGLKRLQGILHLTNVLCATEVDRLARDPKVMGVIEYWCDINKVRIETMDNVKDDTFIGDIHAVVAKKENTDRIERMRRSKVTCFEIGRHVAKPPLGYKYDKNVKPSKLVQNEEISVAKQIFEMRKNGVGYLKIAKNLNLKGKKDYYASIRVKKILENPFYAGYVRYKGGVKKGIHEPIISLEDFEKINGYLICEVPIEKV